MALRAISVVLLGSALGLPAADLTQRQSTNCTPSDSYPTVSVAKLNDPFTFGSGQRSQPLAARLLLRTERRHEDDPMVHT